MDVGTTHTHAHTHTTQVDICVCVCVWVREFMGVCCRKAIQTLVFSSHQMQDGCEMLLRVKISTPQSNYFLITFRDLEETIADEKVPSKLILGNISWRTCSLQFCSESKWERESSSCSFAVTAFMPAFCFHQRQKRYNKYKSCMMPLIF